MKQLTWPTVGFLAVLGAVIVALATLAHWGSGEITTVTAILFGVGGGAAVAGAVSGRVDEVHKETTAQTETINTIERRTNGELDARIAAGAKSAAEQVLATLREQGVIS
ncbi:hypothetical protein [Actinoplanes sp. NPDC051851]|uniref:hypothetical protein n=1 Tax=Actinoplanes sp. NPDC051851 TaxID=3154753 RepID=UPI003443FC17